MKHTGTSNGESQGHPWVLKGKEGTEVPVPTENSAGGLLEENAAT